MLQAPWCSSLLADLLAPSPACLAHPSTGALRFQRLQLCLELFCDAGDGTRASRGLGSGLPLSHTPSPTVYYFNTFRSQLSTPVVCLTNQPKMAFAYHYLPLTHFPSQHSLLLNVLYNY